MSSQNDNGVVPSPTPEQIIALAESVGYKERRPTTSFTLFFVETNVKYEMPPCRINIFYTTRSIMTHLNHPSTNSNELWRSNAYDTLEELRELFLNPRIHTGKGYRNANKAARGCVACGETKTREEFSKNQWSKGPDANKCIDCVNESSLVSGLENTTLNDDDPNFPPLTLSNLKTHDNKSSSSTKMERRQFNCPVCPQEGRGAYLFFKKVPAMKPLVKCPKCKGASQGRCKRLYPVPKGSEKGYGLYKCGTCRDVWGSSRAVSNIGQECHGCKNNRGLPGVMVTPFRLEVYKRNKNKGGGGGSRRVPREPIGEDDVDEREYGDADHFRNEESGGGEYNSAADDGPSYDMVPDEAPSSSSSVVGLTRAPSGYKHSCAGCKRGLCKNRKVPVSEIHDVNDGNTVSTRNSIVTNSSVDKSDYIDRDFDFEEFEL
jgi:hypothetical protein